MRHLIVGARSCAALAKACVAVAQIGGHVGQTTRRRTIVGLSCRMFRSPELYIIIIYQLCMSLFGLQYLRSSSLVSKNPSMPPRIALILRHQHRMVPFGSIRSTSSITCVTTAVASSASATPARASGCVTELTRHCLDHSRKGEVLRSMA